MKHQVIFKSIITLLVINSLYMTRIDAQATDAFANNQVIAHRGAWKANNLPQNSIASLKQAVALGCAGSEFDVHLTADDSLVINHDPEFSGKKIETSTYTDLAATKLSNGETIPTLQQYLEAGLQQHTTKLILEIKPATEKQHAIKATEKVVALVRQLKAQDWIIYISFDYDVVKKIKELEPHAQAQYLNGDKSPEELKRDGIDGADYHFSVFQKHPEWIRSAKDNGIVLNAWTVNDVPVMTWLLEQHFDAITTNEPELLFKQFGRQP